MDIGMFARIVRDVEDEIGYSFEFEDVQNIHQQAIQKCQINGKGNDYVPVMFWGELRNFAIGEILNLKGVINQCANSAT